MRHGRARTVCTALIAFIVLGLAREARSQPCPAVTGDFSQQAVLTMKTQGNSCTIPDGGYVKVNTQVRLHVQSQVTGWCKIYFRNALGFCQQLTIYNRLAANSSLRMDGGATGQYPVLGNQNVQNYNTCSVVGGQCTSVNTLSQGQTWLAHSSYGLGPHVYTSVNLTGGGTIGSGAQYCNMSGFQFAENAPITVNVLKCEPKFLDYNGQVQRLAPPGGTDKVKVFLDQSTMAGATTALDAAIANLNTNQSAQTGITLERVDVDCGANGDCIRVMVVPGQTTCGFTAWGSRDAATGYYTGVLQLRLHPAWAMFTSTGLQRTFVHELQHLMGLDNYADAPACGVSDAAMQDDFDCNGTNALTTLTINDILPAAKTSYGGGPRTACGF